MVYLEIIGVHFDNLENSLSNAVSEESLGIFVEGGGLSAHGKACQYISSMDPIKLYLGWDGYIYPKYKIREGYTK